jgi:hypothetical protein
MSSAASVRSDARSEAEACKVMIDVIRAFELAQRVQMITE